MAGPYLGYIAAAYGAAALAIGGLCVFVFLDARASRRELARLEETLGRSKRSEPVT